MTCFIKTKKIYNRVFNFFFENISTISLYIYGAFGKNAYLISITLTPSVDSESSVVLFLHRFKGTHWQESGSSVTGVNISFIRASAFEIVVVSVSDLIKMFIIC